MKQSKIGIYYSNREVLQVTFSYLIFNVESIDKKFGGLADFVAKYNLWGETNGKLHIMNEMVQPHDRLLTLIKGIKTNIKLVEKVDYVFGYEYLTEGVKGDVSPLLNKEIPEFENVDWLSSVITHQGNYVWNNNYPKETNSKTQIILENHLNDINPTIYEPYSTYIKSKVKLHYQHLLIKYIQKKAPDRLKFNPRVSEVNKDIVKFGMVKHMWSLHIDRRTLDSLDDIKKNEKGISKMVKRIKEIWVYSKRRVQMETIIVKPEKVEIDSVLKNEIKTLCEEESQVVVHCRTFVSYPECLRVWKSTYLIPHDSTKKCALTHAENISFYPQWTICSEGAYEFTLFFRGLPKDCLFFDLFEDIPEPGGFFKKNIERNSSDVYCINI